MYNSKPFRDIHHNKNVKNNTKKRNRLKPRVIFSLSYTNKNTRFSVSKSKVDRKKTQQNNTI